MKRRLLAMLLAGVMILSTGCSANVSVDPDTGVVKIDGVPINELMKEYDTGEATEDEKDQDEEDEEEADEIEEEEAVDESYENLAGGLKVTYPEDFDNIIGIFDVDSGEVGPGIYFTYFDYYGITEDWYNEASKDGEPSNEDWEIIENAYVNLTTVMAIDDDRELDELIEYYNDAAGEELTEDDFKKLKTVDGCTFYRCYAYEGEGIDNLEDDFREEYEILNAAMDDVLGTAEYFIPGNIYDDLIGKKLEFTTKDIDGNEITSEEIFSEHKITVLNVWATWCFWCVDELPELNEINEDLADKDCAVVGLVGDGTDRETIKEAKKILKENGDEYLNILPWDDFSKDLPMEGWPTTFFVDSEGTIVAEPVIGARVNSYKETIDKLLKGE